MSLATRNPATPQQRVKERYELDAGCVPDDIVRTRPEWAGGAVGWWMWWD